MTGKLQADKVRAAVDTLLDAVELRSDRLTQAPVVVTITPEVVKVECELVFRLHGETKKRC